MILRRIFWWGFSEEIKEIFLEENFLRMLADNGRAEVVFAEIYLGILKCFSRGAFLLEILVIISDDLLEEIA